MSSNIHSIAGGPRASETESVFQGRARTLNENTRAEEANPNNKLKITGDIRSFQNGIIREGKYMNLGVWDLLRSRVSNMSSHKRVLQLETIKIYYMPYVSEYTQEFVELMLEVETPNTRIKKSFPVFSCMFRASDNVLLELRTSWILSNINREMSKQVELKYRTGTKLKNCVLGRVAIYCDGHTDSLKNSLSTGSKMMIGRKEVQTGNFAYDISCVKFYYPSGNFKNYDILNDMKFESISAHLRHNHVEFKRDELFDILSSLPLEFRPYIDVISPSSWAFVPPSDSFLAYMRTSKTRNVTPAISYLDYMSFSGGPGDKHVTHFGV